MRIFAGSEWVALIPPIAVLFDPCPKLASRSRTRTFTPARAIAQAAGTPTLPAPMITTSYTLLIASFLAPGERPKRDLDVERPLHRGFNLRQGDPFLAE